MSLHPTRYVVFLSPALLSVSIRAWWCQQKKSECFIIYCSASFFKKRFVRRHTNFGCLVISSYECELCGDQVSLSRPIISSIPPDSFLVSFAKRSYAWKKTSLTLWNKPYPFSLRLWKTTHVKAWGVRLCGIMSKQHQPKAERSRPRPE